MLPLRQRGDTLVQVLAILHGIVEGPNAGRAERHDMIDAFDVSQVTGGSFTVAHPPPVHSRRDQRPGIPTVSDQ
ncbi:hypothetical protein GCM10010344_70080 [Streptomyces bluensis]|nr:hypothetical protein GCM10010344_70080 [Streptomyces bluensis]